MKSAQLPTQKYLNSILRYDFKTGFLYRKVRTANCVQIGDKAGHLSFRGYIRLKVKGKQYYAHRIIWCMINGLFPINQIDHQNHIRTDNRIENLKLATNQENCKNRTISILNTSGTIGVTWNKANKKWNARVTINGKRINLGYFEDKEDAIKARAKGNIKYRFHKNHGGPK
jgi:hypothetical protein